MIGTRRVRPRARGYPVVALLLAILLGLVSPVAFTQRVPVGFDNDNLNGWQRRSFDGASTYRVVDRDGTPTLEASCDGGASAIARRVPVDLRQTPVLHWQWRVDHAHAGHDERTKAGDDFAARVYVIHDGGLLKWRTRAINYVWARNAGAGTHWPNPFADQATMLAVRSNATNGGTWASESRNVRADFERFHGLELDTLDAVAIMTDCDNTGGRARAAYRNLYFAAD